MTPGVAVVPNAAGCLRPAEPQMFLLFAWARRLRPRRAIRDLRAWARLAILPNPLPKISRRRKRCPTPVLLSERRRRGTGGGYAPLPRKTALGQLSGRAVVKAVVRVSADRDQVPAAPLPAWEIVNRVNVMRGCCRLAPAVPQRFLAQRLLAKDVSA